MTSVERRLVDSFWDLRDDAYDHPDHWRGVAAEALFQRLAELVEEAEEPGAPMDWRVIVERLIAWRIGDGDRPLDTNPETIRQTAPRAPSQSGPCPRRQI